MYYLTQKPQHHIPWNKNKLVGQKLPFKLKEICSIRIHLQLKKRLRDLALFNLAIDSKLRACDLVKLKLNDVSHGDSIEKRAMVLQQKTHQPVQFEITENTRETLTNWVKFARLQSNDYLFKSRFHDSPHLSTRNMPELLSPGCLKLVWIQQPMERTHFAEPRLH